MPMSELRDEHCVGLDVGGANLKLASSCGYCEHLSFPLWKHPERLHQALNEMLDRCAQATLRQPVAIGLTMTGELADCYPTRSEGVVAICQAAEAVCPISPLVYSTNGQWLTISEAKQAPLSVAASNWHALASWIARKMLPELDRAVVVDIGSTTTDVIAIARGRVVTTSRTDRDRLLQRELVYTGLRRTPVAALVSAVSIEGSVCPVMAEHFATSDDAYIALGLVQECPDDCETADGRPRTRAAALQRLARMVGEDLETLGDSTLEIAEQVIGAQAERVIEAVEQVAATFSHAGSVNIVASGEGQPLIQRCLGRFSFDAELVDLTELVGNKAAQVGPATAVSHLVWRHVAKG